MKARELATSTSTEYERLSLDSEFNLSDGHSRLRLLPSQEAIIDRFPELFRGASVRNQTELEHQLIESFFILAGARDSYPADRCFLSYSASSAIAMLASYCRRSHKSVALVEPTFDSIASILRREDIPLEVISETSLYQDDVATLLGSISADVIWLVLPNNPTSRYLEQSRFIEVVRFCADHKKMLVFDYCFRFFCQNMLEWSQYEILEQSGVTYAAIEDTGKTWSTLDIKVGMLVCSDDISMDVYNMHSDLLLNVSPFHLQVLTEFIRDTTRIGLKASILDHAALNRRNLRAGLAGSVLEPALAERNGALAREWIHINATFTGEDLWKALRERGVHVLPGSNFYWNDPQQGLHFVRVPLTRDPDLIVRSIPTILEVTELLRSEPV